MSNGIIASFVIWYVVFLFSTTAHEAAHALAGYLGGDKTAYEGGQVTLDPVPHIKRSPFGMVIIPIVTFLLSSGGYMFGFASAPFDPRWAQRNPRKYAGMSFAGPATNFLLALIAFVVMLVLIRQGQLFLNPQVSASGVGFDDVLIAAEGRAHGPWGAVAKGLSVLFTLNVLLGLFNLLPIPPLDGAAVLEGLFPSSVGALLQQLRANPIFGLISLIVIFKFGGLLIGPALDVVFTQAVKMMG